MKKPKPKITGQINAEIRLKILSIDDTGVIIAYETRGTSGVLHYPNNPNKGLLPNDEVTITHTLDIDQ